MKNYSLMASLVIAGLLGFSPMVAQESGEFHLDQNYNIDATGTLHLRSEDADVRITGSSRTDAHVKIDRNETVRGVSSRRADFKVDVENRGGDLYITERETRGVHFQMGYSRTEYRIEIELPESASLRIVGEDDDYVIRNINGKISMESEDGDIELIECNGSDFEFRIEDGDLKMDGGKGTLYVETEDGDVDIRNGDFEKVEMDIEDGNIFIETTLANNGSYDLNTEDSRVEFIVINGGGDFYVLKDDGSVRATADFETIRETDHRSELRLAGGNANVEIRTNDGRVRLSKK